LGWGCPQSGYIVSNAATAALLLVCIVWIVLGLRSEAIIGARRILYYINFTATFIFTMAIPDSLKLANKMQSDATTSGWIISALSTGTCVAGVLIWIGNQCMIDGSLQFMRGICLLGACLTVFGTSAFAAMAWSTVNIWSLVAARMLAGLGIGFQTRAGRFFLNRTACGQEIIDLNTTWALWGAFGFGFGPFLQAAQNGFFSATCNAIPKVGQGAEYQGMVIPAIFLLIVAFLFPSNEELREGIPQLQEHNEKSSSLPLSQQVTIVSCLVVCSCFAFCISSLESATAMLLEQNYGMNESAIALLIGLTFMLTLPLKIVFDHVMRMSTRPISVRLIMILCILGCILLREDLGKVLAGGSTQGRVAVILVADILAFPSMFLCSGLVEGVAFRLATTEGTTFSTNNLNIAFTFVPIGLGRSFGPPLARTVIATASGQTAYSLQQLAITSMALVLIELSVLRELRPDARASETKSSGNVGSERPVLQNVEGEASR
jgi:hypothetical protein